MEGGKQTCDRSTAPGRGTRRPDDLSSFGIANARYAPKAGDGGHVFLNFRRDVSEQVYARSEPAVLETALARGGEVTDDVR